MPIDYEAVLAKIFAEAIQREIDANLITTLREIEANDPYDINAPVMSPIDLSVIIPVIRRVMPGILAKDILSVQPMSGPMHDPDAIENSILEPGNFVGTK